MDWDAEPEVVKFPKKKKPSPAEGWKSTWHVSEAGTPLPNLFNAMVTLRHHPKLGHIVRYDEMQAAAVLVKQIPNKPDGILPRLLSEDDVLGIQEEMQLTGLRRIANATVHDAISLAASEDKFHPIKDYLNSLTWDGVTRIGGWLTKYVGIEDSPYANTIGRLFLIALVARIFSPGCQCDYMLILEGAQGVRKSTLCRLLAGGADYFSDNLPDLARADRHRVSGHLRGKWLVEIGEMSSFSTAEAHVLKEFLTQREERYRPPYARKEVFQPRQCLFIGSTNEGIYLRDKTGGRRFWPVKVVNDILLDEFAADRGQLLAEAVKEYRSGEKWWPDPKFEAEVIQPQQKEREEVDPWEEKIIDWFEKGADIDGRVGDVAGYPVQRCTVTQILLGALEFRPGMMGTREMRRVSGLLGKFEWERLAAKGGMRFFRRPKGWEPK